MRRERWALRGQTARCCGLEGGARLGGSCPVPVLSSGLQVSGAVVGTLGPPTPSAPPKWAGGSCPGRLTVSGDPSMLNKHRTSRATDRP